MIGTLFAECCLSKSKQNKYEKLEWKQITKTNGKNFFLFLCKWFNPQTANIKRL